MENKTHLPYRNSELVLFLWGEHRSELATKFLDDHGQASLKDSMTLPEFFVWMARWVSLAEAMELAKMAEGRLKPIS
jgi:hypothetical protein